MNLVDSCGWLEYVTDGPNAVFFAPAILRVDELLVPSICVAEVFRRLREQDSKMTAGAVVVGMRQGHVVDLDFELALAAAQVSRDTRLPLADSIILATAREYEAVVWTQDAHFQGMDGVKYVEKR